MCEEWETKEKYEIIFIARKIDVVQCIYDFFVDSEENVPEEIMPYVDTILVDLYDWAVDYDRDMVHDWNSLSYMIQDFIDEKNKNL